MIHKKVKGTKLIHKQVKGTKCYINKLKGPSWNWYINKLKWLLCKISGLGFHSSFFQTNGSFFAKKWVTWAIRSWSLIFGERPEGIAHGCSILVSNLSHSLTSLILGEQPERFAHIAHQKRAIKRITHFLNKKTYINHPKK